MKELYAFITKQTKDAESKDEFEFPAEYMFKDVPDKSTTATTTRSAVTLREMDKWGIEKGLIGVRQRRRRARAEAAPRPVHRRRSSADPNEGMDGRPPDHRRTTRSTTSARSACSRAALFPQVAINDKKMYPIYAKCVELGIPVFVLRRRARARASSSSRRRSSTSTR